MVYVGVDACAKGWVAVVLAAGPPTGVFGATLSEVAAAAGDAMAIGIDIPIGLVPAGRRRADVEARARLGSRRSTVFLTPVRAALEASTYAEALAISRSLGAGGISKQAWMLRPRILEAERFAEDVDLPVLEVHPELSFAAMIGRPAAPKRTWAGVHERSHALVDEGVVLDGLGGAGAMAAADDVLDAAAVAWTVRRWARGQATRVPADRDEHDPVTGRSIEIWS